MTDILSLAADAHIIVITYILAYTCGRFLRWMKNNP